MNSKTSDEWREIASLLRSLNDSKLDIAADELCRAVSSIEVLRSVTEVKDGFISRPKTAEPKPEPTGSKEGPSRASSSATPSAWWPGQARARRVNPRARSALKGKVLVAASLVKRLDELKWEAIKAPVTRNNGTQVPSSWLDIWMEPPLTALLTLETARKIADGEIPPLYVVQPQDYNDVSVLGPDDEMFEDRSGDDQDHIGYFHGDGEADGIAGSGGGSDMWWVANASLNHWLRGRIKKFEKLIALGDSFPNSDM